MNFTAPNISSTPATSSANGTIVLLLPSLTQRVISGIAMSVLIILSISGNAMVIASFYYYKKIRRSVTNCFIVSLAVSDLMVAFLSEPFWLSYQITNWNNFPKGWDVMKLVMVWTILDITCAIASIVNLMFISIDRYFAIKSPLSHHTKMTPEASIWIILALWMYSVGTGCLFLTTWIWKFLLIFVIGFLLPLIIMVFCYVGIMIVISSKARLSNQVGSTRLDKEFKTAKSLGVVTGSFVLCWLPFFILSLLHVYCAPCTIVINGIPAATSAVKWLHYLNSCLNPIIYAFLNPTFKVAFRNLFRKCCSNPNNFNDDMTITTMIFHPSNRRNASHRKKNGVSQSNGRIPNGKAKGKRRKLLRFKTPLEESLQDSVSEYQIDKRVNEETYIEKVQEPEPSCFTQPNQLLDTKHGELDSPAMALRHVHDEDEFLHVTDTDPLKMEDCSSILSDSNNNPSDNEAQLSRDSRGYTPLEDATRSSSEKLNELDLPLSNITDTSDISTYHDQESDQFYFYVDGEVISERDIKTSNV